MVSRHEVFCAVQGTSTDSLLRAPLVPGPTSLLTNESDTITAIAATDTDVYFATVGTWSGRDGAIHRLPR